MVISLLSLLTQCELLILLLHFPKFLQYNHFLSRKAIVVNRSFRPVIYVDLTLLMINATNFLFSVVLFLVDCNLVYVITIQ